MQIPLDQVEPSPFQPRQVIDEDTIRGLAESIRSSGLMQPILVRQARGSLAYELIAGERRWRAARLAGLSTIPALVRDASDREAAELALIENLQREDLNAMERAWAFRRLAERFGMSHAELAERVGLERPTVANFVRLTELEPAIQDMIAAARLSAGHGKALLSAPPGEPRLALATKAAAENWPVKRLEQECSRRSDRSRSGHEGRSNARHVLSDLERQLSEHLGTKVSIWTDRSGSRGRVQFDFYSLDHFDGLMAKIGFSPKH